MKHLVQYINAYSFIKSRSSGMINSSSSMVKSLELLPIPLGMYLIL